VKELIDSGKRDINYVFQARYLLKTGLHKLLQTFDFLQHSGWHSQNVKRPMSARVFVALTKLSRPTFALDRPEAS